MEDTKPEASPDEFEVVEMLWIDARCWVDLEGVVVMGRVFEEAVEGIEHLMREQEEKLSAKT